MSEGERRRRQGEGPGWFATLGGAAVLIVLGFGVGLVAGAAWEEPDLVMDHFSGRTTAVPVEGEGAPSFDPPAEPTPLGAPPAEAEVPARTPERPQVAAPAPPTRGGGHAVQVGAFGEREAAEGLARELRQAGFPVYVAEDTGGSARFKVRVGPLAEREEAEQLAARLKREHRLPTWLLSRDPR